MLSSLKNIYSYRYFIIESIKRDFLQKYANSFLGTLWAILNPLSMILVYTLIFTEVMSTKLPGIESKFAYSIYLCAGIIPWGLFVEIAGRSVNVFVEYGNIIKKARLPKICLPVICVGSALINFFIIFTLFLLFLLFTGQLPNIVNLIMLIPVVILIVVFAVSIGVLFGVINVFYRDIGQFFNIFLQFWFWLTPIVYPLSIVPEKFEIFIEYNPMAIMLKNFSMVFVENKMPDFISLSYMLLLTIFIFLLAFRFFNLNSRRMADVL